MVNSFRIKVQVWKTVENVETQLVDEDISNSNGDMKILKKGAKGNMESIHDLVMEAYTETFG